MHPYQIICLFSRGIYQSQWGTSPNSPIPPGPMVFSDIVLSNPVVCQDQSTLQEICLVDSQTKFMAREATWYHFEISAHTYNYVSDDSLDNFWIEIDVIYQIDGSPPEEILSLIHI